MFSSRSSCRKQGQGSEKTATQELLQKGRCRQTERLTVQGMSDLDGVSHLPFLDEKEELYVVM